MTKSRLFSKNSARAGLNSLILIAFLCLPGCSSSIEATFHREDITQAIQDICKEEYDLDAKAKFFGRTLWVYLPLEDILTKKEKPEKIIERFEIKTSDSELKDGILRVRYSIAEIPEKQGLQEYGYDKEAMEKINDAWKVLRRVLFSMERDHESEPEFCCLVIAYIKNGVVAMETFYYLDLKKVSYGYISWDEYRHRMITESYMLPEAIGDKDGAFLMYKDFTFKEFITGQIIQRIKLKFQKPEVGKNADIDKEILKIAEYTLKTYDFTDFSKLELDNLLSGAKIILNRRAILEGVND